MNRARCPPVDIRGCVVQRVYSLKNCVTVVIVVDEGTSESAVLGPNCAIKFDVWRVV